MSKVKLYLAIIAVLLGSIGLISIWFSKATGVSFSWWAAQLSGMKTIQSSAYQVEASGQDIRAYSFIDSHGRYCTTVFASETGSGLDCDFKKE